MIRKLLNYEIEKIIDEENCKLGFGYFEDKELKEYILLFKTDNDYQYRLLISKKQNYFNELWQFFIKKNSCHSCICNECKQEQDLIDVGFKKVNNFYSYYPFSVVYRTDDLTDGKFYVGMCEVEKTWNNGYKGSGRIWKNHCRAHEDHEYQRTVLKENFRTPTGTRSFELQEIEKVFNDKLNCNGELRTQGQDYFSTKVCPECGGKEGHHKKSCVNYIEPESCPECGKKFGHKKFCSKYNATPPCPECGGGHGVHKKTCSKYNPWICEECGCEHNHYKWCSKYKETKCPECGGLHGQHKDFCSKSQGVCQYCGRSLQSKIHEKDCPLYKEFDYSSKICPECGGIGNKHKKGCSKFKEPKACPECGGLRVHKKTCSHYKSTPCPECGTRNGHKKTCSKYKKPKACPECRRIKGHKKFCSQYSPPPSCPECGKTYGHKKCCSKYNSTKPCPYCGKIQGPHKKDCPKFRKTEPCPECGRIRGHKENCSFHKK